MIAEHLHPAPSANILIVDDSPVNQRMLTSILAEQGYMVDTALNGSLALDMARATPPDLILLDIILPGLDGYATCAQLKADQRTADIPIIFLSACDDPADKVKAFESGGADYITKPFQPPEVLARVQTHLARRRAETELRASYAQLQAIVEHAPAGIALMDTEWRVLTANRHWTHLLGLPSGAQQTLLDMTHPTDIAPRQERLHALARGELVRYHRETRLLHQDGGSFWADLLVAPVRSSGADTPTESFVAIVADITERKYTEEQALRQQQALAALRERERLARELHDTTAQVLGYVNVQTQTVRELLATGQVATATTALRDLAHAAHDAHNDVRAFIVGVSTNTRLTMGPSAARCFRTALAQSVEQFTSLAGIPAELIASPDTALNQLPATVELQVLRIVQEALNNVRKHADATHVQVTVAIAHQELCVTVRDDGSGFVPPSIVGAGGARYGLRSMRERAAEIEAELQISSAPAAGTTISLRVPLQQAKAPQEQTILLVDDHALFREGLRNLLATRGLQVIGTASDGREAIAQARALRPNVVLMDMEMPEIDGLSALQQITAELPDTRVVMLTASADDARLLEVVRNGAAGYLLKDQCAEEIFSMLAALARGEVPLAPELVARLMRRLSRQAEPAPETTPALPSTPFVGDTALNPRQGEVLTLIARGMTYKEIGVEMSISEHTVRYHVQEVMSRLNLSGRAELVAYAARRAQLA